jgi:Zn-dependent M28 family amino/carboxypeptidase
MLMLNDIVAAEPASIMVVNRQSDADWNQAAQLQELRTQSRIPWETERRAFPTILSIRESSLVRLLETRSMAVPPPPEDPYEPATFVQVPGLELTIAARSRVINELRAPNTVGILEGSDPTLKDEYVVFSGHMDHVGVGSPNEAGDSIYNGADDDASGTVAVVELAEAFAMLDPAPRRSIVFLTVSGEEKGLWGSAYFANHPAVPVDAMVADINADMIARNWPDSIVVIGKEHSDLGKTLDEVANAHPELNIVPMDDIWPEENFYGRSDHFNFARKGVPILFFFNGTHEDYHRPTDELASIDAEKASRITKLMFYLGLEVANAPDRPRWDPEHYSEIVGGGGS